MTAFTRAPQLVQDTIESMDTVHSVATIGEKEDLRVDQIGVLASLNRNMLLGLISPQEFLSELIRIGVEEAAAKRILAHINQKIFIPLHDKMRQLPKAEQKGTPLPVVPTVSAPVIPASSAIAQSRPLYTPPPPPVRPVASSPLPPKIILPSASANPSIPAMPSINKLQGRVLPPPVYDPTTNMGRPSAVPSPTPPPAIPTAKPYTADPYHEPLEP